MEPQRALASILFAAWLVVCFVALCGALHDNPYDGQFGLAFWMTIFTFPSGIFVLLGVDAIGSHFGGIIGVAWRHPVATAIAVWSSYFTAGLMQWSLVYFLVREKHKRHA